MGKLLLIGALAIVVLVLLLNLAAVLRDITTQQSYVEAQRTAQIQAQEAGRTERFQSFLATLAAVTGDDSTALVVVFCVVAVLFFLIWRDSRGVGE